MSLMTPVVVEATWVVGNDLDTKLLGEVLFNTMIRHKKLLRADMSCRQYTVTTIYLLASCFVSCVEVKPHLVFFRKFLMIQ